MARDGSDDPVPVFEAIILYFYGVPPLARCKATTAIVLLEMQQPIRLPTMVQQPAHSIIAELEDAVRGGSSARRVETLRQVTDLFLNDGERLSDDQVKVFDDVLCLLIARVETRAKAELSKRLAPLDYAPFEVIQYLAWDDEIAVAGDVLTHSSRLSSEALVEIGRASCRERV